MKDNIQQLQTNTITSEIFTISPTQLDYISRVFAKNFANAMNMRTFSERIYKIACESLRTSLRAAKKMGEGN